MLRFLYALDQTDKLAGENHGQKRAGKIHRRKIGYGQRKHGQIGDQIYALNRPVHHFADRHRQRVVSAGGAACAYAEPYADADKDRADDRSEDRHVRQLRPERWKLLEYGIEQRKTAAGYDGIKDEAGAKRSEAEQIAGCVENETGERRRYIEEVVQ